jgi:UDP-N-acetylmuramoyl-tripeptide--D-alanyl-D-alanine ligase
MGQRIQPVEACQCKYPGEGSNACIFPLMNRLTDTLWRVAAALLSAVAFVWRSLLVRTTVIAITGSVGKTTTKECLAAILAAHYPIEKTLANQGARWNVPKTLLRARPWHRFVVAEVGIDQVGFMWRSALILRPDIVIMLHVKRTHANAFQTIEITAAEKAQLLARLGRRGVAILNGDDPRVMAMAEGARFSVRTFGTSPAHDVWSSDATSSWPDRLEFTAHAGGETRRIRTRLVGTHWTPSVLAALAAATHCGLTLEQAAKPLLDVEPYPARMQPIELPSGAVLIRDEFNGSIESLGPAITVLDEARAARRWLVVSDFTDSPVNYRHRLRQLGEMAAASAEHCVFIGEKSDYGRRRAIEAGMPRENVHDFQLPEQAAAFLRGELRAGDLVLLRGRFGDHLSRIAFAQLGTVRCWRINCRKRGICDNCPELGFEPDGRASEGMEAG